MHERLDFSAHATQRMAQRNLTSTDVEYVYHYGQRFRCAGAVHIFLGWRDIPHEDRSDAHLRRLEGTTVLLDSHRREVLTVYRNKRATRRIRRKSKYNRNKPEQ